MNQHKTLILVSVLAASFFVIVLYLLYLVNLKNTQPITIVSPSPAPTKSTSNSGFIPQTTTTSSISDWKTYASSKRKFTFSYPSQWYIDFDDQNGVRIQNYNPATAYGRSFDPAVDKDKFAFVVNTLSQSVDYSNLDTLKKIVNKDGESCYFWGDQAGVNVISDEQTTSINGNLVYSRNLHCSESSGDERLSTYIVNKSGQVIVIDKLLNTKIESDIFSQILSTFKFTIASNNPVSNPKPTITMSVYSNPKYGISFSYPKDCKVIGDQNSHLFSLMHNGQIVSFIAQNNPQNLNSEDLFAQTISSTNPDEIKKYLSVSSKTFNQHKFTLINQNPNYFSQQSSPLTSYHITNNGYDFGFSFNDNSNSLVTQILSTFKFF